MDKDNDNTDDYFMKKNPTLFKKYKIKRKLAEGAFGDIYVGNCIESNEPVAIKVEPKKIAKPLLEAEAYFLFALKGVGIPDVLSFGRRQNYNILVEPLLGKSLFDIFNERRKHMSLPDICLIAKQILDRIQWVHSKGFVHRDIKPDNFLIGRKDPNVIYLIDFGLSKKYKSDKTGKHLKFGFTGKLTGTVRFASANALRGGEQSRKDDLESIAYMIIFFMRGKLPWQGVTGMKKMERYLKIYKMKKNVTPEDLCKSLPSQMVSFVKYVKHLEFEQDPDYSYLRKLFDSILNQRKLNSEKLIFSWIKLTDLKNLKEPVNPASRKESPQGRLYKQIEQKLKSERTNSSDNDSGQRSFQTPNILTQMYKEENYTSKDEAEVDYNYKTKKEKAKEGFNTLDVNINTSLDANVNFEETEKKKGDNQKKNYTVNDTLDYKTEIKISKNLEAFSSNKKIEIARDKSEDARLSNSNGRKMSLTAIDEKEEKNKNEEIEQKENNEINVINIDDNKLLNQKQKIIPIDKGKIKTNSINNISSQNNSNNDKINLSKSVNIPNHLESKENSNNNNIVEPIKDNKEREKEMNIKQNQMKFENQKESYINNKNNSKNLIKIDKKGNSPNKLISQMKQNSKENYNKLVKGIKQNKNTNINQVIPINKEIKNTNPKTQLKNQRINIKTQKIQINKKAPKLIMENDEGPKDNKRKKNYNIIGNNICNTEILNNEVKNSSSKKVGQFTNDIKIENRNIISERRNTPNNTGNNTLNEKNKKYRRNLLTQGNYQNIDFNLLPQNSDEMIRGPKDNENNNEFNNNNHLKKLSNSVNIFENNDNINNNNNINHHTNIKSNTNLSPNNNIYDKKEEKAKPENNIFNNNYINNENNNIINSHNNNNFDIINSKNIEFNSNRKIRYVNRNKNQSKNINPHNALSNANSRSNNSYNTFSDFPGNNNTNYKPQNININNNINNNIIINHNINNKYSQNINPSIGNLNNNLYSNPNSMPQNIILNKRPSHNMYPKKIMNSFNMFPNMNAIQYKKRPSHNLQGNNIMNNNIGNNIFNPMSNIMLTKRPSYNSNPSYIDYNFVNKTEPNNPVMGFTKIKKLPNNNMKINNNSSKTKPIEIIRDIREIKNKEGFRVDFGLENYTQKFNNTFENNYITNEPYRIKNNNNINNNIIINKITNTNNSSKIIGLPEKRIISSRNNDNYPLNKNFNNNNKIMIEKIPNYKTNYQSKIGSYQKFNDHFNNNNIQLYDFSNF